jgi:hypothetical protein
LQNKTPTAHLRWVFCLGALVLRYVLGVTAGIALTKMAGLAGTFALAAVRAASHSATRKLAAVPWPSCLIQKGVEFRVCLCLAPWIIHQSCLVAFAPCVDCELKKHQLDKVRLQ